MKRDPRAEAVDGMLDYLAGIGSRLRAKRLQEKLHPRKEVAPAVEASSSGSQSEHEIDVLEMYAPEAE